MDMHNDFKKQFSEKAASNHSSAGFFNTENTVVIYTVLSILLKMKRTLGLEAALDYVDRYLLAIERDNPQIRSAVAQALVLIDVNKIYQKAIAGNEKP